MIIIRAEAGVSPITMNFCINSASFGIERTAGILTEKLFSSSENGGVHCEKIL